MLKTGTYYVITIGKRYLRFPFKDTRLGFIVGQQVAHAHCFESESEAVENAKLLTNDWKKHAASGGQKPKPVGVQRISVQHISIG